MFLLLSAQLGLNNAEKQHITRWVMSVWSSRRQAPNCEQPPRSTPLTIFLSFCSKLRLLFVAPLASILLIYHKHLAEIIEYLLRWDIWQRNSQCLTIITVYTSLPTYSFDLKCDIVHDIFTENHSLTHLLYILEIVHVNYF